MFQKFRFIAITLAMAILLMVPMSAYAQSARQEAKNDSGFDFAEILEEEGVRDLNIIHRDNGERIFSYSLSDGSPCRTIEKESKGTRTYVITEGDKTNELVLFNDGRIMLDGKSVVIGETENRLFVTKDTSQKMYLPNLEIKAAGGHYNVTEYQSNSPYGDSSYYLYKSQEINKEVAFGKAVKTITVTAIATILAAAFSEILVLGAVASAAVGVTTGMFVTAAQLLQSREPEALATRIFIERYQHSSSSARIPAATVGEARFAWKDVIKYYGKITGVGETYITTETKFLVNRIKG